MGWRKGGKFGFIGLLELLRLLKYWTRPAPRLALAPSAFSETNFSGRSLRSAKKVLAPSIKAGLGHLPHHVPLTTLLSRDKHGAF